MEITVHISEVRLHQQYLLTYVTILLISYILVLHILRFLFLDFYLLDDSHPCPLISKIARIYCSGIHKNGTNISNI